MTPKRTSKKRWAVLAAAGVIGAAGVVGAASASSGDDHKVTICHVTESANAPGYVVITVDKSAFDGEGSNDHTQHYSDRWEIGDVEYVDGACQYDGPPGGGGGSTSTTTTTTEAPGGGGDDGGGVGG